MLCYKWVLCYTLANILSQHMCLLIVHILGEDCLRTADILSTIEAEKESLALIVLPGVQYYTGQKFDMKTITK